MRDKLTVVSAKEIVMFNAVNTGDRQTADHFNHY